MASDFFTVLSMGQHFTEDQWLNVQAFSMLQTWLLLSSPEGPGTADAGAPDHRVGGSCAQGRVQVTMGDIDEW